MNSKKFKVKNSLLDIFFLTLGTLNFNDLRYLICSKNLNELTDFLTIAAMQIPTRKLSRETPIALIVKAKALTLKPPLTIKAMGVSLLSFLVGICIAAIVRKSVSSLRFFEYIKYLKSLKLRVPNVKKKISRREFLTLNFLEFKNA